MSTKFTIENISKIQRGTALNEILCHIKYVECDFEVPYWASAISEDPESREMYERLNAGEFGEVTFPPNLYTTVPKTYNEWVVEQKAKRDDLLLKSDWTQGSDSALTNEKKTQWAEYRQKLRDVPSQKGFPYDIKWPEKP
jgi:hypothetical protein